MYGMMFPYDCLSNLKQTHKIQILKTKLYSCVFSWNFPILEGITIGLHLLAGWQLFNYIILRKVGGSCQISCLLRIYPRKKEITLYSYSSLAAFMNKYGNVKLWWLQWFLGFHLDTNMKTNKIHYCKIK